MGSYRLHGNQATPYNHKTKTGVIGRVFGPDFNGRYHVCHEATYDESNDMTTLALRQIVDPMVAADRLVTPLGEGA